MRKLRSFAVNSGILVTFYKALLCLVLFVGVGIFQNLIEGGWKRLLKKKKKKSRSCYGKAIGQFKTLYEKRLLKMQILNDPTQPMRHYFDRRCSNWSGRFLLPKTNQNVIKPCFHPLLYQFLMKSIIVINPVCTCAKMSAEDDDFQRLSKGKWRDVSLT